MVIRVLERPHYVPENPSDPWLSAIFEALGVEGISSSLHDLEVPARLSIPDVKALAESLKRRHANGCVPLTHLRGSSWYIHGETADLEIIFQCCLPTLQVMGEEEYYERGGYGWSRQPLDAFTSYLRFNQAPALQHLVVNFVNEDWESRPVVRLLQALAEGTVPELQTLCISYGVICLQGIEHLCTAIQNVHLVKLRTLALYCDFDEDVLDVLMNCEMSDSLPALRFLHFRAYNIFEGGWSSLSRALLAGAFPQLETLILNECPLGDLGLIELLKAFDNEEGVVAFCASSLKTLGLKESGTQAMGFAALSTAIRKKSLPNLQQLEVSAYPGVEDDLVVDYLDALLSAYPDIAFLNLSSIGFGPKSMTMLTQALISGRLPCLEHLDLSYNNKIGDREVRQLVKAIEKGGAERLKVLNLFLIKLGYPAVYSLARVLASEACPELEHLKVYVYGGSKAWLLGRAANSKKRVRPFKINGYD